MKKARENRWGLENKKKYLIRLFTGGIACYKGGPNLMSTKKKYNYDPVWRFFGPQFVAQPGGPQEASMAT